MQSKHESSVFLFFVLVVVLFIPFWLLEAIHPVELLPGLPISALAAFMPGVAALILKYKQERLSGVRQLLGRSFDFKRIKNPYWFFLILLINPTIAVLAYGVMRVTGMPLPQVAPWTLAVLPLSIVLFIAAVGEEVGWTGYVTEPLLERWGTINTGLLLGIIWAVIHWIALRQVHRSVEWIAWWSLGTISYRMIMTWLYVHDGKSLFGAALFHAMINLSWQLFPNNGSHYDPRIFSLIAFVIAVVLFAGGDFYAKSKKYSNKEFRMKRFFRCCTVVLGAGIALILLAGVVLYFIGVKKLTQPYPNISVEKVNVPADTNAIAPGEHIAIIWGCTKCHGDDLSGTLIDNSAFSGTIAAPNLTSGNGGIASSYTDTDWVRAIRHGVKPNGQVEILMYDYSKMSDQDLGDLLAYLKQLPPVDSNQHPMRLGVMLPIGSALGFDVPAAERIDHNAPHLVSTVPGATIEYGKYLSAVCTECHQAENIGKAVNDWSREDFIHAFQTGTRSNGEQLSRAMRTKTFSALNETELSALWLYFQSVQPAELQK